MNARQWMRVAAVVSAMGLAGTAIATEIDTDGARRDGSTQTLNGTSMPDATSPDSQSGSTSFDTQSSLDSSASPNPEPDAASRSSNGAITGAVPGSVEKAPEKAPGRSTSNRQPTD
jgi:hypothetical protein